MHHIFFVFIFFFTAADCSAQEKDNRSVFTTKYAGKDAIIQYHFAETNSDERLTVILYRGNDKNEKVKAIHQLNNLPVKSDYYFIDSLLPAAGVYLYTIEIISNNEVIAREISKLYAFPAGKSPSLSAFTVLPKTGTNEISLRWKITDQQLAGNINILRSRKNDEGYSVISVLKNTDNSFTDKVDDANEPFFYMLEIGDMRTGDFVYSPAVAAVADFEIKPQVPQSIQAGMRDGRPMVSWRSSDPLSRGFYVYKRGADSNRFLQASNLIISDASGIYKWTDTMRIKDADYFQYIVFSESNSYTKSNSSDTVIVELPKEAVLPAAPFELHFITDNDIPVQLTWSIDSAYAESMTGFAVYRKIKGEREYSLLKDGVAADQNFISIDQPANGTSFMVKTKSNEKLSDTGAEAEWIEKIKTDFGPHFIKAEIIDNSLHISWQNTGDEIREYRLYKWNGRDYVADQQINGDTYTAEVKSYAPGEKNIYMLKAMNSKGVENEGTKSLTIN